MTNTIEPASFEFFGITFYENPIFGDESPIMIKHYNKYYNTELWDAPLNKEEAQEQYDYAKTTDPLINFECQ